MLRNAFKTKFTKEAALSKAMKYCAYRERSIAETEQKLKEWGLGQKDIDAVMDDLVEQNFINEDRYLLSYVRGKFNSNKWGRIKITAALRQQHFSDARIRDALLKIDPTDYKKTANHLILRKSDELSEADSNTRRSKIYYFMLNKGYESDLIIALMKNQ